LIDCEQADEDGRAQRRQALPDGDRERPVPRQGTHAKAPSAPTHPIAAIAHQVTIAAGN